MKLVVSLILLVLTAAPVSLAAKDAPASTVDSGTFGIFLNGKRTATEKFSIAQNSDGSVVSTDFKTEEATNPAHQTTDLKLSASGELRRYEFKELSPGSQQAVLEPNNEFLIQHSTTNPGEKPEEHPYILPAATSLLDDFVLIHREILAWRFLATGCRHDNGQVQCPLKQKTSMGVVIPKARTSMLVSIEFLGRDTVQIHGQPRELNRFDLKSEGPDWQLWLDDSYKVVRMVIPDEATEIVRD
jgi:hypothetical protein